MSDWNAFRKQHKGDGKSIKQLSSMYEQSKSMSGSGEYVFYKEPTKRKKKSLSSSGEYVFYKEPTKPKKKPSSKKDLSAYIESLPDKLKLQVLSKLPMKDSKGCLRGYELVKLLGEGDFGKVYEACKPDCIYAMKIVEARDKEAQKNFTFEARLPAEILKDTGIAAKTYGWWICDKHGYIVTAKYDISLEDYLNIYDEITKDVYNEIKQKINKLHKLNIIHGDLWPRNIMVNVDGTNITNLVFIDWGLSRSMGDVYYESWYWEGFEQYYEYKLNKKITIEELKANPKLLDYAILDLLKPMVAKKNLHLKYIKIWKFLKTHGINVKNIDDLSKLQSLNLSNNQLTSVPKELGNLSKLKTLILSVNNLPSIPKELGNLSKLTHLELHHNRLTSIPKELGNLSKLTYLNLGGNYLTSIPKELGKLSKLTALSLIVNKFTPTQKEKLRKTFNYVQNLII